MDRARLATLCLCVTLTGCAPGEHQSGGGLDRLFGGGAAGRGKPPTAIEADEDESVIDTGEPASPPADQSSPPEGGAAATPRDAGNLTDANAEQGGAPSSGSATDAGGRPTPATTEPPPPPTGATPDSEPADACEPGFTYLGGQCACDLSGTFALHGEVSVSFGGQAPIEALTDTIELWGIVRSEHDAGGALRLAFTACGQTTPDICAAAQTPLLPSPEAYGQYIPVEVWDEPKAPTPVELNLPSARPGVAFDTPTIVQLFGLSLANPLGAWPSSRTNVQGGPDFDGSATNGASWVDLDGDGQPGLTIRVVGPDGAQATAVNGPPRAYAARSDRCPRGSPSAQRSAYAYFPLPQGLGIRRIKHLYSAQRVAFELHGTLDSCDRISGQLTGPRSGNFRLDALVGGCAIAEGAAESACGASLLDAADAAGGGTAGLLELSAGTFFLARAPADIDCAQVRAMPPR